MRVLTAEQMQQVDAETIARICPGIELMERAGRGCAEFILHKYAHEEAPKAVIFCGPGNNGGDGFVIARYLAEAGWRCSVHLLKPPDALTPDSGKNYLRLREVESDFPIAEFDATRSDWIEQAEADVLDATLLVDTILGTGAKGAPRGTALDMVQLMNDADAPVVCIDMPSGVNASTGEVPGEAVVASDTLTIGAPKIGTLFHPGRWQCGEVSVIDIGFPEEIIDKHAVDVFLLDQNEAASRLPYRPPDVHKFDAGTVIVVAGSGQYRGAALLAGEAALRGGAGMVYLAVPAGIAPAIDVALREAIVVPLPETDAGTVSPDATRALEEYIQRADVIAVGPGLGRNDDTDGFVRQLVAESPVPIVVDADGITAFKGRASELAAAASRSEAPIVITPHSGELARLIDEDVPEPALERIKATARIAADLGVTLVHKGAPTLISQPEAGVYVNASGHSALATGGTGDVLTGLVASFLAQGAEALDAACVACHVHGQAGAVAAGDLGKRGVIAGDLLWAMGTVIAGLEGLVGD